MGEIFIEHTLISTITAFFVQIFKRFGFKIVDDYTPLISMVFGIIGNFIYAIVLADKNTNLGSVLVGGIIAGMTASGGYDAFKNPAIDIKKKIKEKVK